MLLRSAGVSLFESSGAGTSRLTAHIASPRIGLVVRPKRTWASSPRQLTNHALQATEIIGLETDRRAGKLKNNDSTRHRGGRAIPDDRQKKLLTPYELSMRVKALCNKGELKDAINMVKESPRDAQNAIVWNNLIHEVITTRKYKQAYQLFTDMKRRGISPNSRTFSTLLGGYARIEDWDEYTLQLENVYSLYDQLRRYHAQIKSGDQLSPELTHIPYTKLIQIFGQAQQFQRMYDVFNALPSEGPMAPDIHTFTALLNAIANRKLSALNLDQQKEGEVTAPSYYELQSKNASDAKLIWRQLDRASAKTPSLAVDSHALRALLRILSRGRPSDQDFAFEIVHNYLGLVKPGQTALPAKVELHPLTLDSLLYLCNSSKRYALTLQYAQQVIDSDSGPGPGDQRLGMRRILNTYHMDLVLEAHVALAGLGASDEAEQALETLEWMLRMAAIPPAPGLEGGIGPQIRPASSTFDLVLLACWRGVDWKSACRTFELMTGYGSDQFYGEMVGPPEQQQRSAGRALVPSAGFMSSMLRTAIRTHQAKNMQLVLNIFEHYGWDRFFKWDPATNGASRKQEKDWIFYSFKLAEALSDGLSALLKLSTFDTTTKARWEILLARATDKVLSVRNKSNDAGTEEAQKGQPRHPNDRDPAGSNARQSLAQPSSR